MWRQRAITAQGTQHRGRFCVLIGMTKDSAPLFGNSGPLSITKRLPGGLGFSKLGFLHTKTAILTDSGFFVVGEDGFERAVQANSPVACRNRRGFAATDIRLRMEDVCLSPVNGDKYVAKFQFYLYNRTSLNPYQRRIPP